MTLTKGEVSHMPTTNGSQPRNPKQSSLMCAHSSSPLGHPWHPPGTLLQNRQHRFVRELSRRELDLARPSRRRRYFYGAHRPLASPHRWGEHQALATSIRCWQRRTRPDTDTTSSHSTLMFTTACFYCCSRAILVSRIKRRLEKLSKKRRWVQKK